MSSPRAGGVPEPSGPPDPEAIKADIEATREQLARTVDELSSRLDVPARARQKVAHVRETALDAYLENPPGVLGAGLAVVALLAGVILWRWKRSSSRRKSRRKQ